MSFRLIRHCHNYNNYSPSGVTLLHTLDNPNAYGTVDDDNFGWSVAISGNFAIVGVYLEDDADGTTSGKAYIYNVTTGALVHTLDNPNAFGTSAGDNFGVSVAIGGNNAIVGASEEDDADGTSSGKAYIFNVTTGALVHTLDNPNDFGTSAGDRFSWLSLAIDGDYAAVGAFREDHTVYGSTAGRVYIFNVTTGALVHTLEDPKTYTGYGSAFGSSVSISGNLLVTSAATSATNAGTLFSEVGTAWVFDVTTGALLHTIDSPHVSLGAGEYFGNNLAISGNQIIVGAYNTNDTPVDPAFPSTSDGSGKAYIFQIT